MNAFRITFQNLWSLRTAFQLAQKVEEKLGRSKILQRKMPEKQKINILWFTKDLGTRDSESL